MKHLGTWHFQLSLDMSPQRKESPATAKNEKGSTKLNCQCCNFDKNSKKFNHNYCFCTTAARIPLMNCKLLVLAMLYSLLCNSTVLT